MEHYQAALDLCRKVIELDVQQQKWQKKRSLEIRKSLSILKNHITKAKQELVKKDKSERE